MILDWKTDTETRLPDIPNGVRITSPFSAGGVLLPLSASNNYTPEVMICGGSSVSDAIDPWGAGITSQTPASDQCIRMVLTTAGIAAGWQIEHMSSPRVMGELVQMPDGRILVVNGAKTGVSLLVCLGDKICILIGLLQVAGYGNVSKHLDVERWHGHLPFQLRFNSKLGKVTRTVHALHQRSMTPPHPQGVASPPSTFPLRLSRDCTIQLPR